MPLTDFISEGLSELSKVEFCSMSTPKGTEETKEQGAVEVKVVDTVDYRSPAGEDKEPKKEKVEVTHEIRDAANNSGHPFAGAAAAVANTIQSAKDAISSGAKDDKTTK